SVRRRPTSKSVIRNVFTGYISPPWRRREKWCQTPFSPRGCPCAEGANRKRCLTPFFPFFALLLPSRRPWAHLERRHHALDGDPDDRHGNEHLPAEPHDLGGAIARERRSHPQEDEAEQRHLEPEPDHARCSEPRAVEPRDAREGRQPPAQEEHRG